MDKFCTACHYDGMLLRFPCPSCGKQNWYCSDCHVGNQAYNCGECQAPPEPLNTLIPCPLCKAGMLGDPEEIKHGLLMICDGCNSSKFDKRSEPGMPGLFFPYKAMVCQCGQDCGDARN